MAAILARRPAVMMSAAEEEEGEEGEEGSGVEGSEEEGLEDEGLVVAERRRER